MANPEPIPGDPMVYVSKWTVTKAWFDWLLNLATIVYQGARRLGSPVSLTNQSTSIGATPLVAGNPGGRFRISVFVHVEQQASVSSSIVVTIGFQKDGHVCAQSTTAIVNGGVTSSESRTIYVVNDPSVALTFSTTYASVGGTPMTYGVDIVVESMS